MTTLTSLNKTLTEEKILEGALTIKNNRNQTLDNILFSLTGDLSEIVVVQPQALTLSPFQEQNILITVNKKKSLDKEFYTGALIASRQGFSLSFPMSFTVLSESPREQPPLSLNETTSSEEPDLGSLFNYSVQPPEKVKQRHITLITFIIIIFLSIIFYLLMKRPYTKRQTFKQYIGKMEKNKNK